MSGKAPFFFFFFFFWFAKKGSTHGNGDELQFGELTGSPANEVVEQLVVLFGLGAVERDEADGLEGVEVVYAVVGEGSQGDDELEA